jgi:hypothetical protein
LPDDLYDYLRPAPRRRGRPAKKKPEWTVTDNWPDEVPITEAEIEVFEARDSNPFPRMLSLQLANAP